MLGGSPPLVRGLRYELIKIRRINGITPAGAGTTFSINNSRTNSRDHPRWCGDYLNFYYSELDRLGSPPLVRGLRISYFRKRYAFRITPAGAGTTTTLSKLVYMKEDHPRWCGDYIEGMKSNDFTSGSPPLVRGLL